MSQQKRGDLKKEELVKQAFERFYRDGCHATGVDTILAGTGISKRTLYKYFGTKEELIKATIEYYHRRNYDLIDQFLHEDAALSAPEKVLRLFDFLINLVNQGECYGCFAINAKTEFVGKSQTIEASCLDYALALEGLIQGILEEGRVKDAAKRAAQVLLVFNGAIVQTKQKGDIQPALLAKELAQAVLEKP